MVPTSTASSVIQFEKLFRIPVTPAHPAPKIDPMILISAHSETKIGIDFRTHAVQ
jgi:hypothetical protein